MSDYISKIDQLLTIPVPQFGRVLDLFAGAGGLGLGFEAQGFETIGYEKDNDSCLTYHTNLNGKCIQETLSANTIYPHADIVIGGPPCQPFSVGGYQKGLDDSRDGFPAFISAVAQLQPSLFLFENVRGMMYRNKPYLQEIIKTLQTYGYIVEYKLFNLVQYGVPQKRQRGIVVGHKGGYQFPIPTMETVTAGEALGELATQIPTNSKFFTPSMDAYVAKYEKASKCIRPRDLHLNKPSRTVTCRNLAGATGDMMRVRLPDGRRRRLTVEEGARLQSFPSWYQFQGSEISQYTQIGNAVPPLFAYYLAQSVRAYLQQSEQWLTAEEICRSMCNAFEPQQLSLL